MPNEAKNTRRLSGLDILRGMAALAVVFFHYAYKFDDFYADATPLAVQFSTGFYGVHLFFMVSGFVILMSLVGRSREIDGNSRGEGFIRSRFIRLYPLFWASVLLTSTVLILIPVIQFEMSPVILATNLTMLQDYAKIPAIDGVYWSLTYELGFYVFMYAIFRFGWARLAPYLPLYMVCGTVFFYFASALIPHPLQYLLMIHSYGHLFGAGMAFYLISRNGISPMNITAIAAVPFVQFLYDGTVGLIAGCVIIAAMGWGVMRADPFGIKNGSSLLVRSLIGLGGISYALYLTHQMIGYVVLVQLDKVGVGRIPATAITFVGAILLAIALTYLVERPAANYLKKKLPRHFTLRSVSAKLNAG